MNDLAPISSNVAATRGGGSRPLGDTDRASDSAWSKVTKVGEVFPSETPVLTLAPDDGLILDTVVQMRLPNTSPPRELIGRDLILGARAYSDRLVLFRSEREVVNFHGDLRTAPWANRVATLQHRGAPDNHGHLTLPPDAGPSSQADRGAGISEFDEGRVVETFLPSALRARISSLVPAPTTHIGRLLKYAGGLFRIELVRVNGARGLALIASRHDVPGVDWDIDLWGYEFLKRGELGP